MKYEMNPLSTLDIYYLLSCDGIGYRSIFRILNNPNVKIECFEDLLTLDKDSIELLFPKIGGKKIELLKNIDKEKISSEYVNFKELPIEMIPINSPDYPSQIIERLGEDSPSILFLFGEHAILKKNGIAVIGSRDVSRHGCEMINHLLDRFRSLDISIVSGGAQGIDISAHRTAIELDMDTILVAAEGILSIIKGKYPEFHNRILALSQFLPYARWDKGFAMLRNTLICALSKAVFVIEARKDGGAVHAAKMALKLGVPLYVVHPDEFKKPPPGNEQIISLGGRAIYLESLSTLEIDV
jgi:DNA processing protein